MANYVLLYSGGRMPENEAEQAAVMQAWGAWYGKLGGALVDAGNPFGPQVKNITGGGAVGDGALGSQASGYTIIAADSLDAATALATSCPLLQVNGQISVYETIEM